jgi:hypothetical protein
MNSRLLACAILLATTPATAAQYAAPIAAPNAGLAVLRTGTEVSLRLSEELTTKDKAVRVGQRFRMETAEAVVVQGVTVIPAGSPAVGEVVDVKNSGGWGKSGKLNARVLYVTVNGRQIRLSGAFDEKGASKGVAAVAVSALVFAPAGFFMKGKSAQLPIGTPVKGFIDEDVPLQMAAAPQPLSVNAPATAQPLLVSQPR